MDVFHVLIASIDRWHWLWILLWIQILSIKVEVLSRFHLNLRLFSEFIHIIRKQGLRIFFYIFHTILVVILLFCSLQVLHLIWLITYLHFLLKRLHTNGLRHHEIALSKRVLSSRFNWWIHICTSILNVLSIHMYVLIADMRWILIFWVFTHELYIFIAHRDWATGIIKIV